MVKRKDFDYIEEFNKIGTYPSGSTYEKITDPTSRGQKQLYWKVFCSVCREEVKTTLHEIRTLKSKCCCRRSGHYVNKNLPKYAYFYVSVWKDENGQHSYLKFGVTSMEVGRRLRDQQSRNILNGSLVAHHYREGYVFLSELEKQLKRVLPANACPVQLMKDGYTETVINNPEHRRFFRQIFQYLEKERFPTTTGALRAAMIGLDRNILKPSIKWT